MYNWSVDLKQLKKDSQTFQIWRLEQLINFGLNGERLDKGLVKTHWKKLRIDPRKREFLKTLLWEKKS